MSPDDDHGGRIDVSAGVDTDGDQLPDTLVSTEGELLRVATDIDRDGLADVIVEIGPDATVHTTLLGPAGWTLGAVAGLDPVTDLSD